MKKKVAPRGKKKCFSSKVFKKLMGRMNGRTGKWVKAIDYRTESLVDRRPTLALRGNNVNIKD